MSAAVAAQRAIAALIRENAQLATQAEEQAAALRAALDLITQLEQDLAVYRAAACGAVARDVPALRLIAGGRDVGVLA